MPKIVDSCKKRELIAHSATKLFLEKGYSKLTVSEVAQNAGVAKGSIYKYFDSKEDIVFAIIELAQESYDKEILYNIQNRDTIEEKILALFDLCISNNDIGKSRRKLYREFISICLDSPSEKMISFLYNMKEKYILWLEDIFRDAIKKGILKEHALEFVDGLFIIGEGILMFSSIDNYNNHDLLQKNIKSLLNIIKIEKRGKDD
jgi:AcrR family transcriptional regulator